jgi:hypothetical protein
MLQAQAECSQDVPLLRQFVLQTAGLSAAVPACLPAEYQPVAHHSSLLYFCVTDLSALDPMYCFSLRWFNQLFVRAILDSPQSSDVPTRLQLLNDYFAFFLYQNVCRYRALSD